MVSAVFFELFILYDCLRSKREFKQFFYKMQGFNEKNKKLFLYLLKVIKLLDLLIIGRCAMHDARRGDCLGIQILTGEIWGVGRRV